MAIEYILEIYEFFLGIDYDWDFLTFENKYKLRNFFQNEIRL